MRRLIASALAALFAALFAFVPSAAATPGDPYAPEYYFDQWHVPQLWADGARGQGITIGEIDTGVDANLAVFAGRVLPGVDLGRLGGDGRVDRDKDAYGHGTSMASIMVGRPGQFGIRGIAPGARVLPVAIPLAGTTDAASDDRLAQAIRWAADHGANIISMSLGGVRRAATGGVACPDDEQQAIYHALRRGALVMAAAGNRGGHGNGVEEPGVCLGVVSVGAVDEAGAVAAFSSRQRYLTLTAPGVDIASVGHGGSPFSGDGTSQATAVAAGAAALVWSKYPKLSADQVVARILATLAGHGHGHSSAYGYGRLDAQAAVTASVPSTAPDPVAALVRPFLLHNAAAAAAAESAPAPPHPAARADHPPGRYAVGSRPGRVGTGVIVGAVIACCGLVGLLVLCRRRIVQCSAAGGRRTLHNRVSAPESPGSPH